MNKGTVFREYKYQCPICGGLFKNKMHEHKMKNKLNHSHYKDKGVLLS